MPVYNAPAQDIRFVLHEVINYEDLCGFDDYRDATGDVADAVVSELAKLCEETLLPLNLSGDEEGCACSNKSVTTPKGFKEAYDLFVRNGWTGISADPEYGGQGLPNTLNFILQEMISAANMAFGMYPGLTQGAYDALHLHGNEEQKRIYLPKLASGIWSGTMNLTEPQCGTDLGLIKTKAVPNKDGSYNLTGQKIYISAGEHDLTENIIHLVLARLPDAPEGVRGISLFVVPKYFAEEKNGEIQKGKRNEGVFCQSIEKKMGIKASATCVMIYEDAKGWLVGEPHKGLRAMFTMMNAARLAVGMQGLGIAEVARQNAVAFARERLQMRALDGPKQPEKPADPIIVHPDVRKNLLTMKAFTEGARALSYWTGVHLDISLKEKDRAKKQIAEDFVALMTPVIKAYLTDMGSTCANLAVQVYGGHGYIHDYGVEQFVRDARIAQIYEGTNGIQALDLVGRKMSHSYGRMLRRFFHPVSDYITAEMENPEMQPYILPLAKAFAKLQQSTAAIAMKGLKNPNEAGAASTDYLRQFALVAMGYMWARMCRAAILNRENNPDNKSFYDTKLKTARFFFDKMLPETDCLFKSIMAGADSVMALDEDQF